MKTLKTTLAVLATSFALLQTSNAGTFTHLKDLGSTDAWVFTGEIVDGDAKNLQKLIDRTENLTIVINSPGGNAMEGMALGRLTMKYRDQVALVAEKAYSAAAMWWLGDDAPNYLDNDSEVGFHLSYMWGKKMGESTSQVMGYVTGKYLEEVLDEDGAANMMVKMADVQEKYGKFAMFAVKKGGKSRIIK